MRDWADLELVFSVFIVFLEFWKKDLETIALKVWCKKRFIVYLVGHQFLVQRNGIPSVFKVAPLSIVGLASLFDAAVAVVAEYSMASQ